MKEIMYNDVGMEVYRVNNTVRECSYEKNLSSWIEKVMKDISRKELYKKEDDSIMPV